MRAYPASSCTYRERGVYNLSVMITVMWRPLSARGKPRGLSHGLYVRPITQSPILYKLYPMHILLFFFHMPANVSSLGRLLTANGMDVGGLRGSVWQRICKWIVFIDPPILNCTVNYVVFLKDIAGRNIAFHLLIYLV